MRAQVLREFAVPDEGAGRAGLCVLLAVALAFGAAVPAAPFGWLGVAAAVAAVALALAVAASVPPGESRAADVGSMLPKLCQMVVEKLSAFGYIGTGCNVTRPPNKDSATCFSHPKAGDEL